MVVEKPESSSSNVVNSSNVVDSSSKSNSKKTGSFGAKSKMDGEEETKSMGKAPDYTTV